MSKTRRLLALTVVTVMAFSLFIPSSFALDRYSGGNRYETSAEISKAGWEGGSDVVILARGDDFADALAGVPLAYKHKAPVLLTRPDVLPEVILTEIQRLNPSTIYLLGGKKAISEEIEKQLVALGIEVTRIGGGDRYDTAVQIAWEMAPDGVDTAYIVYSLNFPDALSAASYAAMQGCPILLTNTNALNQNTANALTELGVQNTFVIGGTGAISSSVMGELPNPERIAGSNRYLTSLALADRFFESNLMFIATGTNASGGADAISGGALAALRQAGILLVDDSLFEEVLQFFGENVEEAIVFGGLAAVSPEVAQAIKDALNAPDGDDGEPSIPPVIPVSDISVDKSTLNLNIGEGQTNTGTIIATVSPGNATNKGVNWSSSDDTVATVDANGKVTAVATGITTITATSAADGTKTATCTVTVANDWSELADISWYTGEGPYTINTAQQLVGLALLVNRETEPVTFSGKTINLGADIDLFNLEWVPIGDWNSHIGQAHNNPKPFQGTFDGGNNTISNLKINMPDDKYSGLFGAANGTIKNLRIRDFNINALESVGGVVGSMDGTVSNIIATNITINANHWAGGVVGYGYVNISDCSVNNVDITLVETDATRNNGDKAGGLIGFLGESKTVQNSTAKDVNITGVRDVGGLIGNAASGVKIINCHVDGGTVTAKANTITNANPYAGGVLGRAANSMVVLFGCTAEDVTVTSYNDLFKGDIVGGPAGNVTIANVINPRTGIAYGTIQGAINVANPGDTILVAAGTYQEQLIISKQITLLGAGDKTIIRALTKTALLSISGNGITIKNLKLCGADGDEKGAGIKIASTVAVDGFTLDNCTIEGFTQGIYADTNKTLKPIVKNVVIKNSRFLNNTNKGIYIEKLSESTIEDCAFEGNGTNPDATGNPLANAAGAGIDINAKYTGYQNITISRCRFTNNGTGTPYGGAILVKARGTGDDSSYSEEPATLTGVSISNCEFVNNAKAIVLGEYDKNNTGPDDVLITNPTYSGNIDDFVDYRAVY